MARAISNAKWKGGTFQNNGYVYEKYWGYHPRADSKGYVLQHILRMEEYLEKLIGSRIFLNRGFSIHHKNGNTRDNRIENLKLFLSHSEHSSLHRHKDMESGKLVIKGRNRITWLS